ncbi:YJR030C-like protein [Saccharomyces kudriavzevii IFO 1802]|uniref:YJR030C-like protein n=2 Tax=Saccharomyces kudriavzevii (strain ATCC MYA-4449 / AS 2.2408 / CBS 8840 / NBRC 1802 / NCYC 2889) TaxID=226230 RepID=J8TRC4_SACK1|nr:YJR030C-like protein [Saccharomyces kudriavzevii IFO 1802]
MYPYEDFSSTSPHLVTYYSSWTAASDTSFLNSKKQANQDCAYTNMDSFNKEEASFQTVLKRLLVICESHSKYHGSSLDPMVKVGGEMGKISSCLKCILRKHAEAYHIVSLSQSAANPHNSLFAEVQILDLYHSLLFGCMRLLLDIDMPYFRMNSQKHFAILLFKVYYKLRDIHNVTKEMRLGSLINAFIHQFKNCYNSMSCNSLRYGNARDIMSRELPLMDSQPIDLKQHIKKAYFRLDIEKLKMNNKLVEVFELTNGEMAIFEVLSGEMPYTLQTVDNLFQALESGNHDLMDVGRSLLFQTFGSGNLHIIKVGDNGVKLQTSIDNGMVLKLTCKDPIQWQAHWRDAIRDLFDRTVVNKYIGYKNDDSSRKSCAGRNEFKRTPSKEMVYTSTASMKTSNIAHRSSTLHRSTPLSDSLSSLIETSEGFFEGESNSISNQKVVADNDSDIDTSLKDIESLSCEKLIELDRSMQVPLSPKFMDTPTLKNVRSASQIFSLESVSPELVESVASEVDDVESIISDDEKDRCEKTSFDPDVDYYKPALYRHKSSSLLSIFSRNKKNLILDTSKNHSSALFGLEDNQPSPIPVSTNSCNNDAYEEYVPFPSSLNTSSSVVFFENDFVKVSLWNGKSWMPLSKDIMCLSLILSNNNETLLIIYKDFEKDKCKFVVKLESSWKCNRSTAQDVQLQIPSSDFKVSAFEIVHDLTLSVRCAQAPKLMSVLQYQLQNSQALSLSPSTTARTLSTISSSSCFSRNVTRSSTENSELGSMKNSSEIINSSLLLSSIKVRQHVKTKCNIWKPSRLGFTDIFSQDYKGVVVAIKFVIFSDAEGTLNPREYTARLHDLKRLGRTGLTFSDQTGAYLLEFRDQDVANHVHKLIMPFNSS